MNPFTIKDSDETLDKQLIKRTLEGEKRALNELIELHQPFIYNIARSCERFRLIARSVD